MHRSRIRKGSRLPILKMVVIGLNGRWLSCTLDDGRQLIHRDCARVEKLYRAEGGLPRKVMVMYEACEPCSPKAAADAGPELLALPIKYRAIRPRADLV